MVPEVVVGNVQLLRVLASAVMPSVCYFEVAAMLPREAGSVEKCRVVGNGGDASPSTSPRGVRNEATRVPYPVIPVPWWGKNRLDEGSGASLAILGMKGPLRRCSESYAPPPQKMMFRTKKR